MKQKRFYTSVFFFISILVVSCFEERREETKTNILFIVVDDLRPTLGCYHDPLAFSPNIDKLAINGITFTRAYCQQAVCNPSRASVMTGLRPDQIGVTDLNSHFREKLPNVVTLPQLFSKNGYATVSIGKIFHGAKKTQDDNSWTKPALLNLSVKADEYALPENKTGKKEWSYECADLPDNVYEDGKIADLAINQLQEFKQSGTPFFLAVGFKKPHLPFNAPKKYWDLYEISKFGRLTNEAKPSKAPSIAFHNSQELRGYKDIPEFGEIDSDKEKILWHGYYSCISFVDAQVGKILNALENLGMDKNTIIILWGDHGYHVGEQQLWCKSTNFELDNRIPFIISIPGLSGSGAQCDAIVEAVDFYPTLIDLCGIKPEGNLNGRSLKPLLINPDKQWNHVSYSQFCRPYEALISGTATYMGYSVRTERWRYTVWYNLENNSAEFRELYDLGKYGIERQNLSGGMQYMGIETKLNELLDEYRNKR